MTNNLYHLLSVISTSMTILADGYNYFRVFSLQFRMSGSMTGSQGMSNLNNKKSQNRAIPLLPKRSLNFVKWVLSLILRQMFDHDL